MSRARDLANLGDINASDLTTGTLGNTVQDNITRLGTVTTGTLSHGTTLQGYVDSSNTGVTFPTGHIIQVKEGTYSTENSTNSMNFTTVTTNVTVDITPRTTSSKFLIFVSTSGYTNGGYSHVGYYTIMRGSTDLGSNNTGFADVYQGYNSTNTTHDDLGVPVSICHVDHPPDAQSNNLSRTTAITYKMSVRSSSNSYTCYWSMNGSKSSIIVMELVT